MKTYFKITILAVFISFTFSCEDFLNVENYSGVPADGFITSVENAQSAVNGAYSGLYGLNLFRARIYYYLDFATNELEYRAADETLKPLVNFGYFDGSTWVSAYWKNLYTLVASSNDVCSKMHELRRSGMLVESDNQKLDQMIGECNFLRGLGYFYLTRSFGDKLPSNPEYNPEELGVPIIDTLVVSKDQLLKSRNTLRECWAEIIKDFETAYNFLPASWSADKMGAVTKGAAAGYLGQVYMYLEEYDKARDWFEKSMTIGQYKLTDKYALNFDLDHENNSESIFEVQFQTITSDVVWASYMWRSFGPDPKQWGTVNVSQQYVDKFSGGFFLDQITYDDIIAHPEKYINLKNPRKALVLVVEKAYRQTVEQNYLTRNDFFSSYTGSWDGLATEINAEMLAGGVRNFDIKDDDSNWGTIDSKYVKAISAAAEKDNDPRMYDSFYVPNRDSLSDHWNGKDTYMYTTNYYGFKKYIPYNAVDSWTAEGLPGFDGFNSINQRVFRLGDMYLQYAEACYRSGNESKAIEYMNKVRRRAWGYAIDAPSPVDFISGDFMSALIKEREKELCLEGHLWFDYLRLNLAESLCASRGFDPKKHHRLPVPLSERQVVGMNILLQNSGY